ncbi:MAG: hypothetical protein N3B11_00825 [Coriobacteriia bacterium]|nr:hypothetical protein [Coriobacteriia bacterium]
MRPSAASSIAPSEVPLAAAAGIAALAVSVAASGLTGLRSGSALWWYVAQLAIWSATRLGVLAALSRTYGVTPAATAAAWAVSLPPFALGAVPGAGLVAFVASALVARSALVAQGAQPAHATRLVAWAYLGHAAGVAAATAIGAVAAL